MNAPLVSCIMPTGGRRPLFEVALRCYQRQDFASKELIVIDDGEDPVQDLLPPASAITYLRLRRKTLLGEKLNLGIAAASGKIIQKLDDDDYYRPAFLSTMVAAIGTRDPLRSVAAQDCFYVLVTRSGHLTDSGHGWCAGHTLCFHKQLWLKAPFRSAPRAVDYLFLQDHAPERITICNPTLSFVVRHELGHTWTQLGRQDVTAYFERRDPLHQPLRHWMPPEDAAFYASLRLQP
jgi:glycosyltransferase involved in cell wall biosynthesis